MPAKAKERLDVLMVDRGLAPSRERARALIIAGHVTVDGQVVPNPLPAQCTYAVAAQDIFGRFTPWQTAPYESKDELPQAPAILSVQLDLAGALTVDFSWDWSDRSPEFMELAGFFEDDPTNQLLSTKLEFGGQAKPKTGSFQVVPLLDVIEVTDAGPREKRASVAAFGAAQDRNPDEPDVRFYRLTATVPLTFGGKPKRTCQVHTRGQCHAHHVVGVAQRPIPHPDLKVSDFGLLSSATVFDPVPPPPPTVPEAPQWASLPDVARVSRTVLSWKTSSGVKGYALYEATETTLLAALGLPGPDTSRPFTDRLAVLRAANLPALRSVFRRVQEALIPPAAPNTTFEVALPRGSSVMHFYAVTAMSPNQQESDWPPNSKQFIAVAAPRLAVPSAPAMDAEPDTDNSVTYKGL